MDLYYIELNIFIAKISIREESYINKEIVLLSKYFQISYLRSVYREENCSSCSSLKLREGCFVFPVPVPNTGGSFFAVPVPKCKK